MARRLRFPTSRLLAPNGVKVRLGVRVAPMDIRVGDTIQPWKVTIDWSTTLKRFLEEVGRRDIRNVPAAVSAVMRTIFTVFSPSVSVRSMMSAITSREEPTATPPAVLEALLATRLAPTNLSSVLELTAIPPSVAAILFQIAMQGLHIPCTIQRGWVRNIGQGARTLFPGMPIGMFIYHAWNLVEINREWIAADVTAGVKSVGEQRKTMDEAGYSQDLSTMLAFRDLPTGVVVDWSDLQMGMAVTEVHGMALVHLEDPAVAERLPAWLAAELLAQPEHLSGIELIDE